jgi:uncharacterized protein (TIGR02594 family)
MTTDRVAITEAIPLWYSIAAAELGVHELAGVTNTARILEYHATTTLHANDDETSWCSSFCNWALMRAGIHGTNSAAARSWATWGVPLQLPKLGCVVVLERPEAGPSAGHVGFFVRASEDGKTVHLLGGNQAGKVCGADYPAARAIAYRWPK